jgi:hypothetical protein
MLIIWHWGSTLLSIMILSSIVDLNQIHLLVEHTSHLDHLIMKNFIPLFIPPSYIYSYTIKTSIYSDDIDKLCSRFSHVKSLKIRIYSVEMMIKLINRLKHLEQVVFWYNIDKYLPFLSMRWLRQVVYRFRREKFTYEAGDYHLMLSIGNRRGINNKHWFFSSDDQTYESRFFVLFFEEFKYRAVSHYINSSCSTSLDLFVDKITRLFFFAELLLIRLHFRVKKIVLQFWI